MPKKKTSSKKSEKQKETIKEPETKINLEKEVENAEKEIEQEEPEFFDEPISRVPIFNSSAPVLERIIQTETPMPIIEAETFSNQQQNRDEREERKIDYSPNSNQPNYGFQRNTNREDEKKYESTFVPPVLSARETSSRIRNQELLPREQMQQSQNQSREEGRTENSFDTLERETRLPFEEQRKYKRFKF